MKTSIWSKYPKYQVASILHFCNKRKKNKKLKNTMILFFHLKKITHIYKIIYENKYLEQVSKVSTHFDSSFL